MYGPNGIPYLYSFREEALPDYTQSYSEDGHTVTNTYDPKVNITVNKFWTGSQYPRPYIEVKLYRNGVEISTVPLTTNTSYTWANLDRVDDNGKPYVYTVDEPVAPSGYIKTVSGYNITNTYVGSAYTGDDRSVRNYAAILFVSLLAIAVLLYFGSKPRQMRP